MASASVGTSPLSGFEFDFPPPQHQHPDSTGDPDEAFWTTIPSNPSSGSLGAAAFISSPASHSLGSSWAVLGSGGGQPVELEPSPAALPSPLNGSFDHHHSPYSTASLADQQAGHGVFGGGAGGGDLGFLAHGLAPDGMEFIDYGGFMFDDHFSGEEPDPVFNHHSITSILAEQQPAESGSLESRGIQGQFRTGFELPPAESVNQRGTSHGDSSKGKGTASASGGGVSNSSKPRPAGEASPIFIIEDPGFVSRSPPREYTPSFHSASVSPPASASPRSPPVHIKREAGGMPPSSTSSTASSKAIPIIRKANSSNRVQKRKGTSASAGAAPTSAPHPSPSSLASASSSTSSSSSSAAASSKFLIVTPDSILQHAHAASLFECLDAMQRGPTQRGRKGPLATDTKQSALQVRRRGACFSCHARKVRCDKERPCRSCVRLAAQVPGVVCWQFGDFTTVLFPDFIRGHLRRDEVARFVEGNVESFAVGGVEMPCLVRLFSGIGFRAVLEVKAKFFTARTPDVLQHWHVVVGRNGMDLHSRGAAPIGLEMGGGSAGSAGTSADGGSSSNSNSNSATATATTGGGGSGGGGSTGEQTRSELKKKVREYIQAMTDEPRFAELVTPPPQHTELPRRVLAVVHEYARRSEAPMVRRALSIYAMHFVMTRHLCLTPRNIAELGPTGLVPQGVPWVTPRVLNRQIKAVVDEMLCREMVLLFENFAKSLKPKMRREWAPCLAAFLVLCLFMETVETAADMFVISDNEINLRHRHAPAWKRAFVLDVNAQIENMPFRQFAFQFHQIYQTHSRDAAARSFNPLVDDACLDLGELDRDAADMVRQLRRFINEDWAELDYLTADPILPNIEDHPYPRNVSYNYTGRLVAKFLLSFTDEKYIFDGKA